MNQNKRIYIITGTIASGKSTFSNLLKKEGFLVVDADRIVHSLYKEERIQNKLVDIFGIEVLNGKEIDRKVLGNIIFNDKRKKSELEKIVHPEVLNKILEIIEKENIIFIEIPLYNKMEVEFLKKVKNYKLIVIDIENKIQIERLIKRNDITKKEAKNLIDNNENYLDFSKSIDYYIINDNDINNLKKEMKNIIEREKLNENSKEDI